METIGVLFIATGEIYVKAAIRAAHSVLKHCPDLPIHLYTDEKCLVTYFEKSASPFTSTGKIENPHPRSKVDYLSRTPYDRTLYLDTDTALNTDIRDMFSVLDRFDIAMAHAQRRGPGNTKPWRIVLPNAFPEFNSGVVLYRRNPAVIQFLEGWGNHFRTDWVEAGIRNEQMGHDQTTLRELLWLSDLRIATLPPEYNVRYLKYHFLWSKSEAETKIFHLKQLHQGWLYWIYREVVRKIRKLILGK